MVNTERLRRDVEEVLQRAEPEIIATAEQQGRRIAEVRREIRILTLIRQLQKELEASTWIRPPE